MSVIRNPESGQVELELADLEALQELVETWHCTPDLEHDLQTAGLLASDAGEPAAGDELTTLLAPMTAPMFWLDIAFADLDHRATHRIWARDNACTVLAEGADGVHELSSRPTTNIAGILAELIGLSAHRLLVMGPDSGTGSTPDDGQPPIPVVANTFDPLVSPDAQERLAAAARIGDQLTPHNPLRDALTRGRWRTWQVACSRPLVDGSIAQAGLTVLDTEHGALRVEGDQLVATTSTHLWLDLLTLLPAEAASTDGATP